MITRDRFEALAKIHQPHSVSIYMPTHRAGVEVNEKLDKLMLKNKVKEIKQTLLDYQMKENEVDQYIKPIYELLEETNFWNNQLNGLALFLAPGKGLEYYRAPITFDEYTYVADHFYLKPLIPLFIYDKNFYVLALSQKNVSLYEANTYKMQKLDVEEFVPERIEEVVGTDFRQKSPQFRSGQDGQGKGIYHGQGSGKDDYKTEVEKFLQHVDKGLMKILHDKKAPLIVAAVDYLYGYFKDVTAYKHLYDDFIPGNPDESNADRLHREAISRLEKYFKKEIDDKHRLFEEAIKVNKASCDLEEIIPYSVDGRVGSLFIKQGTHLYGLYDHETRKVIVEDEKNKNNSCLYNLATIETMLNSGNVFITKEQDMPDESCEITAIFRY
ncbi:MAG: hypothetical protein K9I94_07880 [Bacteroidales bacterium]|nr:hypothetical protein [Bacteroidales bacterium]